MNLTSSLSSGTAVISIIATVTILVLLFLRKLKQKTEQDGKISILWTIPFVILIVISIGLIGATIATKIEIGEEEENMDDIVRSINPIIENARQRLNLVDIKNHSSLSGKYILGFREKFEADNRFGYFRKNSMGGFLDFVLHKGYSIAGNLISVIKNLQPNPCSYRHLVSEMDSIIAERLPFGRSLIDFFHKEYYPLETIVDKFYYNFDNKQADLTSLQRHDSKRKVQNGIDIRKRMLDNFESDMNNTQTTRREWVEKMMSKLSDNLLIIKITVILACSIIILLSAASIAVIVFGQKLVRQKLFPKISQILLLISGVSSILISLIVIVLSLNGSGECSLNDDNFGLKDFLSPIPGNESLTICHSRHSSFYASLENDTVMTFEDRMKEFDGLKDVFGSRLSSSLRNMTLNKLFFDSLEHIGGKLKAVNNVCIDRCFPNVTSIVCEYRDLLRRFFDGGVEMKTMVVEYNDLSKNRSQIAYNAIDRHILEIFDMLKTNMFNPLQEEITAADFPCTPLIDKFSHTGPSICNQLDVPIDIFYIYLIIVVALFIGHLIINTLMLKYSFNGKKNGTTDSQNKSTIQSTTPHNNV